MLTSAAAIAGAVTALVGVYYAVVAALKKNAEKKKITTIENINTQLKQHMTDEEREKLQNALNDIINS